MIGIEGSSTNGALGSLAACAQLTSGTCTITKPLELMRDVRKVSIVAYWFVQIGALVLWSCARRVCIACRLTKLTPLVVQISQNKVVATNVSVACLSSNTMLVNACASSSSSGAKKATKCA